MTFDLIAEFLKCSWSRESEAEQLHSAFFVPSWGRLQVRIEQTRFFQLVNLDMLQNVPFR